MSSSVVFLLEFLLLTALLALQTVHAADFSGPFTVNKFVLPDGTLLFHDLFISSDKTIVFVSAPGFGVFKNAEYLKSLNATALYSSLGARDHDMELQLSLNVILDELTPDGEVKVVCELSHPNLERVLATSHHITVNINFLQTSRQYFLKTELPVWYRSKYDIVVFTMMKTEHTNQIQAFIQHYRSLGADHILIYLNGKFTDFPKTMELVFTLWENTEPGIFNSFEKIIIILFLRK